VFMFLVVAFSIGAPPKAPPVALSRAPAVTIDDRAGDPYGYASYDDFYRAVASGIKGVLVVGIEDRYVQSYTAHYRVPSGFGGFTDGEYDCYPENGVPQMQPRKAVSPKASGKSGGPVTTDAPNAATSPRPAVGTSPSSGTRPRVISIGAPNVVPWASTDCPTGYG
jgi:hypothetical protein